MNHKSPIIVIAGPTASGKSLFGLELAKAIDGTIINFDSIQVYKDLHILTARPNKYEMKVVSHKLYGFLSGEFRCTAIYWRDIAIQEIKNTFKNGKVPILVGGTGLYVKSLIDGITDIPATNPIYKKKSEELHEELGAKKFFNLVKKVDPIIVNNISVNDYQRLVRAYTVWLQTKIPLSKWQKNDSLDNKVFSNFIKIKITPERDKLRNNIKIRFQEMVDEGVVNEIESFKRLNTNLPIMKAHGLREIINYIDGKISFEEATNSTINQINKYAKRQDTWFRNKYYSDYEIINTKKNLNTDCSNILSMYKNILKK